MKSRLNSNLLILVSLFSILFLLNSCQKENSGTGTDDQQQMEASRVSSESDSEAEIVFNGVFDDAMGVNADVGLGGTGVFGRTQACPDITVVHHTPGALFPVTITLDYGGGCTGNDGRHRRGKVIIKYTNRLINIGASAETRFENFYIDSVKVEGKHVITNTSPGNQVRRFEVQVIDGKLSHPNGNYVMWNSHKSITQFEGLGTPLPVDDQFKIETVNPTIGTTKRGNLLVSWQSTITEPLLKKFVCHWIIKGKIKTVRQTMPSNSPWIAVLDFAPVSNPPQCDRFAVVTINGVPHQITLP